MAITRPPGLTVIQRASSDLSLNPHFHTLFPDGVYLPGPEDEAPVFQAAPKPTQEDIEGVVQRAKRRIPRLFSAATVGVAPAGPAQRRAPIRLAQGPDTGPEPMGYLGAQDGGHQSAPVLPPVAERPYRRAVGGYKAGTPSRGFMAALLSAVIVGALLWGIFGIFGGPVLGFFAGAAAGMLVLLADVGLFIGALIGGYFAEMRGPRRVISA